MSELRLSFFKETFRVSARFWMFLLLMIVAFFVLDKAMQISMDVFLQDYPAIQECGQAENPETCMTLHSEEIALEFKKLLENMWFLIGGALLLFHFYIFALAGVSYKIVHYSLALLGYRPDVISAKGYWHYIKQLMWKYTRPLLWNLIPVLGTLKYIHSLYRYQLVGPMTVLGEESPLKKSWSETKGQFWRIFGVEVLVFSLFIFGIILLLALSASFFFMNNGDAEALNQSLLSIMPVIDVIFAIPMVLVMLTPVVMYDVLLKEKAGI